jgi:hypothetical protein
VFCRKCGTKNDDNAFKCVRCGDVIQDLPLRRIDNHLVMAIIVTVLCCLPCGIVGIVYAAQVNSRVQGGDIAGAEDSARKARLWSLWGVGLGLAVYGLYFLAALGGAIGSQ